MQKPERNLRSHPVFRNYILHDKRLKINNKTKNFSVHFPFGKETPNHRGKRKISIYKKFIMCYYVCGEDWALAKKMCSCSAFAGATIGRPRQVATRGPYLADGQCPPLQEQNLFRTPVFNRPWPVKKYIRIGLGPELPAPVHKNPL